MATTTSIPCSRAFKSHRYFPLRSCFHCLTASRLNRPQSFSSAVFPLSIVMFSHKQLHIVFIKQLLKRFRRQPVCNEKVNVTEFSVSVKSVLPIFEWSASAMTCFAWEIIFRFTIPSSSWAIVSPCSETPPRRSALYQHDSMTAFQ